MWQVGVVFAALSSFCGAAGDALVRLSFVLEAKRRRKQRQVLLLRHQLQSSGTRQHGCRVVASLSKSSTRHCPRSNTRITSFIIKNNVDRCDNESSRDSDCDTSTRWESQPVTNERESRTVGQVYEEEKKRYWGSEGAEKWTLQVDRTGGQQGQLTKKRKDGERADDVFRLFDEGGDRRRDQWVISPRDVETHSGEEPLIYVPARPFYLRPLWLLGICLGTVINTLLSIISLDFASAAVITPFAGLHIFWNVIFSRYVLQERVLTQHYVGSAMVLFGLFLVLCYGIHTPPTLSLEQLLRLYSQSSCRIYFCLSALILFPCAYIGVFGKDALPQQRREEQQHKLSIDQVCGYADRERQQGQQRTHFPRRRRLVVYHVVGDDEGAPGLMEVEEEVVAASGRSSRDGVRDGNSAVTVTEGKDHAHSCERRSDENVSLTFSRKALRRAVRMMKDKENKEELKGLSGKLCEAFPEGERSFSSFTYDDDESPRSASEGNGLCSPRSLQGLCAPTEYCASAASNAEACSYVGGGVSVRFADGGAVTAAADKAGEMAAAAANPPAAKSVAGAAGSESDSQWLSNEGPLRGKTDRVARAAAAAAQTVSYSGVFEGGKKPSATPAADVLHTSSVAVVEECGRSLGILVQSPSHEGLPATATSPVEQQQERIQSTIACESRKGMERPCGTSCRSSDASTMQERTETPQINVFSDTSPAHQGVMTNGNISGAPRQVWGSQLVQQQQHTQGLQNDQYTCDAWEASLPAALQVRVPGALRRFCIAAASGACGGNTNIMMEHVMDVWHTESFAALFHPKFLLLLLFLGVMALGQLTFLNLGLSRYEALYVVPTTMSILIICSCLGEISVFVHLLELSRTDFFVFAGGALSIVCGIMVLSAADIERQQETSTAERMKDEDNMMLETELSERPRTTKNEHLSDVDIAELKNQRPVLTVHVQSDRRTIRGRCITTSTDCTSNPDTVEGVAVAATISRSYARGLAERLTTIDEEKGESSAAHHQKGRLKTALSKKRKERRRNQPERRGHIRGFQKISRNLDQVATTAEGPASEGGDEEAREVQMNRKPDGNYEYLVDDCESGGGAYQT